MLVCERTQLHWNTHVVGNMYVASHVYENTELLPNMGIGVGTRVRDLGSASEHVCAVSHVCGTAWN